MMKNIFSLTPWAGILMLFFSVTGCIRKSEVAVNINRTKQSNTEQLKTTVSNIQVVNHQIIITGTNLSAVQKFKIKEGSQEALLEIESSSANTLIANVLSNVSFSAGKVFDFILSNAQAASTFTVNFSLCDSTLGGKGFNCSLAPNDKEVLSYNASTEKWEPRSVNGLSYQGTWDANTSLPSTTTAGDYFVVSVANSVYAIGDWIVFNGTTFDRIDNSQTIVNVFGRTGAITANEGDYQLNQLADVVISSPVTDQVLKFNGTAWVNSTSTFSETDPSVQAFAKAGLPTCSVGQVLKSNGTSFSCVADANGTFSGTASRVVVTDGTGALTSSSVTSTILNYLSNVTSDIQTQINSKLNSSSFVDWSTTGIQTIDPTRLALPTCNVGEVLKSNGSSFSCVTDNSGGGSYTGTTNRLVLTDGTSGALTTSTVTNTEAEYLSGVSSNIQTQLNAKQATLSGSSTLAVGSLSTSLQNAVNINPYNTGAGQTGEFRFYELASNGTNYTGFKSADSMSANLIYVLPTSAPTNGQMLTSDASGNLSWTTATGGVSSVNSQTGAVTLTTANIAEGTNLYHTDARVLATPITAPTLTNTAIATSDTVMVSLGKLQAQVNSKEGSLTGGGTATQYFRGDKTLSTFASDVLSSVLSTFVVGAGTKPAIATTDTVSGAFGKVQKTLNDINTDYVSKTADQTINGSLAINSVTGFITVPTPINPNDAVNKSYVDGFGQWGTSGGNVYRSSGNVGIGTNTPGALLDVNGILKVKKEYQNILEVSSADTPTHGYKILTNLPYTSGMQMPTIKMTGFAYGNGLPIDLTLVWYIYNDNFMSYKVSAAPGTLKPNIELSNESGKVVIMLSPPGYYYRFKIDAFESMGTSASHFADWTWSDSALTGTNTVTVAYTENLTNALFVDSNNRVGIGTTTPQSKLDVNGSIKLGVDATACSSTIAGAMRFNTPNVEYCNGTAWTIFSSNGSAIDATSINTGVVDNTEFNYLNGVTSSIQTQLNAKEPLITAGSSAQYLKGDKSLGTFATEVLSIVLTGLSTATNAVIAATDSVLGALGKLQAQVSSQSSALSGKLNTTGGTLSVGTINGVPTPTNSDDVANKGYVDSFGQWTKSGGNIYRATGSVGIGNTNPATALDVTGTINASNSVKVNSNTVVDSNGVIYPGATAVSGADCSSQGAGAIARDSNGDLFVCN